MKEKNHEHQEAIDYFCQRHREVLGRPYFFMGGRDGRAAKVVLGFGGLACFKALVDLYFERTDLSYFKDDEKVVVVHSLSHMVNQVNYLRSRPHFNSVEKRHLAQPDSALMQITKLKEVPTGRTRSDLQTAKVEESRKVEEYINKEEENV